MIKPNIIHLDRVDSTNNVARASMYRHGDVIVALEQSSGRGQRGSGWESAAGENLTFSMVLEPTFLPAEYQFYLLETVALGLADALALYGIDARIKWPNDIYVGSRKIAGVLIENDICGANLSRSIVGIGLNVNQTIFSDNLPNPVSMLSVTALPEVGIADNALKSPFRFDLNEVLNSFLTSFGEWYSSLDQGFTDVLEQSYRDRLYCLGVPHRFRVPRAATEAADMADRDPESSEVCETGYSQATSASHNREFTGVIVGVLPSGELLVRHPDDIVRSYLFKEIEYILS